MPNRSIDQALGPTFLRFIESMQAGVTVIDREYRICATNAWMRQWMKRGTAEMHGQRCYGLFHHADSVCADCAAKQAFETGREAHVEHTGVDADGGLTSASIVAFPLKNEAGEVEFVLEQVEDTTTRARAEQERTRLMQALVRSDARYRTVVEHCSDLIWLLDGDGRVTWLNEHAAVLLGGTVDASKGRELIDWLATEDRPAATRTFAEVRRGEAQSHELSVERTNGEVARLSVNTIALREEGRVVGTASFGKDVTAQKQAEGALRASQEQFLQAQKMEIVGRLAGGIAHDFNNLLTVICSEGDCAKEALDLAPGHPAIESLDAVRAAADRAAHLTRQLLTFSRRQSVDRRDIDVNKIVGDLTKMLGRLLGEDITLQLALGRGLGSVHADPGQIEQAVVNLAINARDAMPKGGVLSITTAVKTFDASTARPPGLAPGAYVELVVRDTGCGFTPEVKNHLFEPFFTTKGVGKGTGLGLATTYGIVTHSGGTIMAEGEPGEGATFRILLPQVAMTAAQEIASEQQPFDFRGKTVLYVEDEPDVRKAIGRSLRALGLRVIEAGSPSDALARWGDGSGIDVVVTDVVMPEMSGVELVRRMRQRRPVRVLFTTGYTDEVLAEHGILGAGESLLQKPFTNEALGARLGQVLARGAATALDPFASTRAPRVR